MPSSKPVVQAIDDVRSPCLRHLQKLRQVQRTPPGGLLDLRLATEAIRHNQLFLRAVSRKCGPSLCS